MLSKPDSASRVSGWHRGRMFVAAAVVLLTAAVGRPATAQERVLVEAGSPILYLSNADDPGIGMSWTHPVFPDDTSSDLVLVSQLAANRDLQLTRGPYLQLATPTSITHTW